MALQDSHHCFRKSMLECHLFDQHLSQVIQTPASSAHLSCEAIFLNGYVAIERLLESAFIAFTLGEMNRAGFTATCYLKPTNEQHAYDMIKSSQPFLDWTSPDVVIRRCETYFLDGNPIKTQIATRIDFLRSAKRIRNYIAHRSRESDLDFQKVLNALLPTPPLTPITCGHLLSLIPNGGVSKKTRILSYFLNGFSDFGDALV